MPAINKTRLREAKALIESIKSDSSLLHNEELGFLREFITSHGGSVPELDSDDDMPPLEEVEDESHPPYASTTSTSSSSGGHDDDDDDDMPDLEEADRKSVV
eukprot:TRINITY_DN33_c0_g1_i1.p1 TRINITY_DN33_c0_g1~~TRINITY_DN33_c0_g1_i1.p1  ORF type:complete len:120 (-),score=35.56 TRINITY_DN33_c0_g1_i1:111-416(-)